MELTNEQYERIEKYLPKQRGNVKIDKGIWLLAYDIHAHEPLEQKRRSRQSFRSFAS